MNFPAGRNKMDLLLSNLLQDEEPARRFVIKHFWIRPRVTSAAPGEINSVGGMLRGLPPLLGGLHASSCCALKCCGAAAARELVSLSRYFLLAERRRVGSLHVGSALLRGPQRPPGTPQSSVCSVYCCPERRPPPHCSGGGSVRGSPDHD